MKYKLVFCLKLVGFDRDVYWLDRSVGSWVIGNPFSSEVHDFFCISWLYIGT